MDKNQIIDIILMEEKNLWRKLKICEQVKGDDKLTEIIRSQWSAIYRLIQKLDLHNKRGVEKCTDYQNHI